MMLRTSILIGALALPGVPSGAAAAERTSVDGQQRTLLADKPWVRFEVVMGRLTALATNSRQSGDFQQTDERRELLAVDARSGRAGVRYELADERQLLLVEVVRGRQLTIDWQPRNQSAGPRVEFFQPPSGSLLLTIGDDGATRSYRAPTLWHLLLAHPEACEHLLPLLEAIRPGWQLERQAMDLKWSLVNAAARSEPIDAQALEALVRQLGSREFQRRQDAFWQLHAMGQSILVPLESLDTRQLDAEQRARISRLRRMLAAGTPDTAHRVAAWLLEDPGIWICLLASDDRQVRQAAAAQLQQIYDRPIDFDPAAARSERSRQIARLQSTLHW